MPIGYKWAVRIKTLLLLFCLGLSLGLNHNAVAQLTKLSNDEWDSTLYRDHQLVGKIWDSAAAEFISPASLSAALDAGSYLLLGEKHDNPDHHRLQLMVLNYLIDQGRVSRVAFEMLDSTAQHMLDDLPGATISSSNALKRFITWDEEGWDWDVYGPLVGAVYAARLPIAAANISAESMAEVYAGPLAANITDVLDEATLAKLNLDIDESHCGLLPESQFPAMVRVQQARDDAMAASLQSAVPGSINILVAGNYHIRQDLGVPNYLLAKNSALTPEQLITLSFMEVDEASANPVEYQQQFGEEKAYDFIWFTPAVSNEDYCSSLRQEQ